MSVISTPIYGSSTPSYNPDFFLTDPGIVGYSYQDEWGNTLRQTASGGWEQQLPGMMTGAGEYADPTWIAADPNRSLGYDWAPYRNFLMGSQGRGGALGGQDNAISSSGDLDPNALENLFASQYSGRYANYNPYFSPQIRDNMRALAEKFGLKASDADQAALDYASQSFNTLGQPYSEATSPAIVQNYIAARIFEKAGKPFTGMTPEQLQAADAKAGAYQERLKATDADAWKADPLGGPAALLGTQIEDIWGKSVTDQGLPSEQALVGASDPISTWFWNKLLNKDWDPVGDNFGAPTKKQEQTAASEGTNMDATSVVQPAWETAATMVGTAGLGSALEPALAGTSAAGSGTAIAGAGMGARGAIGSNQGASAGAVLAAALLGALKGGGGGWVEGLTGSPIAGDIVDFGKALSPLYGAYKLYESAKEKWQGQQQNQNQQQTDSGPKFGTRKRTEEAEKPSEGMLPPDGLTDIYAQYQKQLGA